MTRRGKIALGATAAVAAIAALMWPRKTTSTPDVPQPPGGDPPGPPVVPAPVKPRATLLLTTNVPPVTVDATRLEPGWSTVGWWSYQGNAPHKMWIRIDKGPWTDGMVTTEQPWRWTWIEGTTPMATEVRTFSQIDIMEELLGGIWEGRNDEIMLATMPRLAADTIDAAYGGG